MTGTVNTHSKLLEVFLNVNTGIVEKNPKKFKIDEYELKERRSFIDKTKWTVKVSQVCGCHSKAWHCHISVINNVARIITTSGSLLHGF